MGGGVGGAVGVVAGNAVVNCVVHPFPVVMQQYSFCSMDHMTSQFAAPFIQSNGRDVVPNHDRSHHNTRSRRGSKQRVMTQVKSRLFLMTLKSPPYPT